MSQTNLHILSHCSALKFASPQGPPLAWGLKQVPALPVDKWQFRENNYFTCSINSKKNVNKHGAL